MRTGDDEASPGPYTIQRYDRKNRHDTCSVWGVFDANEMLIADFMREADARWFVENGPDEPLFKVIP